MKVLALQSAVGAEVRDVDVTRPLDTDEIAELRQAFREHLLLLVRGQDMAPEDHDRLVKTLGPLQTFDNGSHFEFMTNTQSENASMAGSGRLLFHNDGAFRAHPRAGTSLYAINVSPSSPPTSFANGVRAYESLSDELKERIADLTAVHILDLDDPEQESRRVRMADFPPGRTLDDVRHAVHPVVVTLPHSDRKAVFVSEFYTSHIVEYGSDSAEGEALLQAIFSKLYTEDNVYSHHYQNGDLVVWHNLGLQHARSGAVDSAPRHLRRLVLQSLAA
jgi:taurine dioxygenase